jgi:periplasmic divalent cation tolerance protein
MTAGSEEEARKIASELVSSRLAACVNMIAGMKSIYRWEGRIQEDREMVLIAKTTGDRVDALTQAVRRLHSYDCPCVVSLPVEGGNPAFLEWVAAETAGEADGLASQPD